MGDFLLEGLKRECLIGKRLGRMRVEFVKIVRKGLVEREIKKMREMCGMMVEKKWFEV